MSPGPTIGKLTVTGATFVPTVTLIDRSMSAGLAAGKPVPRLRRNQGRNDRSATINPRFVLTIAPPIRELGKTLGVGAFYNRRVRVQYGVMQLSALWAFCAASNGGCGSKTAMQPGDAGVDSQMVDVGSSDRDVADAPLDSSSTLVDAAADVPPNVDAAGDVPATADAAVERAPDARSSCQKTIFPVGHSAQGVALVDFTGDGIPDLFVPEGVFFSPVRLSVAPGNGAGSFGDIAVFETSPSTVRFAAGDFDGDQRADVVAMTNGAVLQLLRGTASGKLAAPTSLGSLSGSFVDVVAADFTGDGKMDIGVGAMGPGRIEIMPGVGNGTFLAPLGHPIGAQMSPYNIILGDFNEDNRPDLLVLAEALAGNRALVLLGQGNGSFTEQQNFSLVNPTGLATGDLDKDGHVDLVATFGNNLLTVQLGTGQGTFSGVTGLRPDTNARSGNPLIADVDGDTFPDVITGNTLPNSMSILRGHGDGTFDPGVVIPIVDPNAIFAGDLNRDGIADIVTTDVDGAAIFLGPCP